MGRKKGFDEEKIGKIVAVLIANPDGIWINRIAESTKLHPTTVTKYVEGILRPLVEDTTLAGKQRAYLRIIKLKPFVIERLQAGSNIRQIMKILRLISKVES